MGLLGIAKNDLKEIEEFNMTGTSIGRGILLAMCGDLRQPTTKDPAALATCAVFIRNQCPYMLFSY